MSTGRFLLTARIVHAFVMVLLVGAVPHPAATAQPAGAKILLVGTQPDHPHGSHMYMLECQLLAQCLRQVPGVEAVVSLDWPGDPQVLEGVKSVVCYSRPAAEIVLAAPHREAFQRLMNDGVGFVAVHWATGVGYSKLADDETFREAYKNILGGWFRRPPGDVYIGTGRLVQVDRQHPICRGWDGYDVQDEFYLDLVFHPDARPVLQANVQGNDHVVGWVFQRPDAHGGRSFGTVLGHYHDNFVQEGFRLALVNGILWSAHLDVPEGGANVTVDPHALQLPPPPTAETVTP